MEIGQSVAAAGLIMMEMKNRLFVQGGNNETPHAGHRTSGIEEEGNVVDMQKKWERLLSVASGALDISREKAGNDVD